MASSCPLCRSEILPGEVSASADGLERARCLCCGSELVRPVGSDGWEVGSAGGS